MPTYDQAKRRKTKRTGAERGVWVYVPAVELKSAGFDPQAPAPFYRLWPKAKGTILVQLYAEP